MRPTDMPKSYLRSAQRVLPRDMNLNARLTADLTATARRRRGTDTTGLAPTTELQRTRDENIDLVNSLCYSFPKRCRKVSAKKGAV
jgi:hypothetical protein